MVNFGNMGLNRINQRVLLFFFAVNTFPHLILWFTPLNPKFSNSIQLFLLNLSFTLVVTISCLATLAVLNQFKKPFKAEVNPIDLNYLQKNLKVLIIGPIIGFILIFYDRVFVRGIDYSQNLRLARYEWLDTTGGSLISILGNLLVPLAYIAAFFLILFFNKISKLYKFLLLLSSILGIFGHAALNGGRSNILLGITVIFLGLIINRDINIRFYKFFKFKYILMMLMAISYIFFIIQGSANLGDSISVKELTILGVDELHGKIDSDFLNKYDSSALYSFLYSIAYLFHGQWTASEMFNLSNMKGSAVFFSFSILLTSIGLIDEPLQANLFSEQGIFLSLPGSYYYEGGISFFIIFCIFHGIVLGISFLLLNKNRIGLIELAFVTYVWFLSFLSPILPAMGLSYLQFIVWAFILLWLINFFIFRKILSIKLQ